MKTGGSRLDRRPLYAATTASAAGLFAGCVIAALATAAFIPLESLLSAAPSQRWAVVLGTLVGLGTGLIAGRIAYRTEIEIAGDGGRPVVPANDPAPTDGPRPANGDKRAA